MDTGSHDDMAERNYYFDSFQRLCNKRQRPISLNKLLHSNGAAIHVASGCGHANLPSRHAPFAGATLATRGGATPMLAFG